MGLISAKTGSISMAVWRLGDLWLKTERAHICRSHFYALSACAIKKSYAFLARARVFELWERGAGRGGALTRDSFMGGVTGKVVGVIIIFH